MYQKCFVQNAKTNYTSMNLYSKLYFLYLQIFFINNFKNIHTIYSNIVCFYMDILLFTLN